MNLSKNVLEIEDLEFSWNHEQKVFLHIPKFELQTAEKVFVHGPSGSGKSSFLNLVAGLLVPQKAKLKIADQDIMQLSDSARDLWRAQNCGFIFQQFNLIPYLSVKENLRLVSYFAKSKMEIQELDKRAKELLTSLQLDTEHIFEKSAYELSVGQQQRLAVVRALLHKPKLIIADEPTSALDSDARDAFMTTLARESEQNNCALLFVSHDKDLSRYFHRKVDIRDWRLQ